MSALPLQVLKRVPEVFDCWFESGSMPYAQQHYPFENKEKFENGFPADFIAEGLDQTRGPFFLFPSLMRARVSHYSLISPYPKDGSTH